jgi:putative MATE family efflux protein
MHLVQRAATWMRARDCCWKGPVGFTILRLSVPNVIVMVVQTSIGLIETYFVAKLGLDALAGMALVFPLYMLLQMVTAGAMGGGILSAVARALGSGQRDRANDIVWYAVAITIVLGAFTTVAVLLFAPRLYALMGGRDGSLAAATTYSAVVFAGTIPLWLFNSFAAVIRGTGNMLFPAAVISVGALVLIPLSPALIFGLGPFPQLGIAGGALAVVLYYAIGSAIFAAFIWSGRGVLKASLIPPKLAWAPLRDILRVGAASSVVSLSTNISIATATGLAGLVGPAVVAGYGTGVRLEYLLVPLVFGLGTPVAAMVGTCIGAGRRNRALWVAWTGAALAAGVTEAIGLAAAFFPSGWLALFGSDPNMIAVGTKYLQIVGPFYGFFGGGLALYFASQGAGQVGWAMMVAVLRVVIAAGGGWFAVIALGNSDGLFVALAAALVVYGLANAAAVAGGTWFKVAQSKPESALVAPALL